LSCDAYVTKTRNRQQSGASVSSTTSADIDLRAGIGSVTEPVDISPSDADRREPDRRRLTWQSFVCSLYKGRRGQDRRGRQDNPSYYIDLHEPWVLFVVAATLVLSVTDVYNTLTLLAAGGTELNPFMRVLIERNTWLFFTLKYLMTAGGLLVLVMHRHFSIFRIIRADYLLVLILIGYVVLVIYEFWLLQKI